MTDPVLPHSLPPPTPTPTPRPNEPLARMELVTAAWIVRAIEEAGIYDLRVHGGRNYMTVEAKIGDREAPSDTRRDLMCTGPTLGQAFDLFLTCISTLGEKKKEPTQ